MPIGGVPMNTYRVENIDEAAASFPDLNFEIIHSGLMFAQEIGWQLARFDNVYVNLELTAVSIRLYLILAVIFRSIVFCPDSTLSSRPRGENSVCEENLSTDIGNTRVRAMTLLVSNTDVHNLCTNITTELK